MPELPAQSGIYRITCLANGEFYVGSAVNMRKRQILHLSQLDKGKHHNRHLQNTYNKYGDNNLVFDVLEFCAKEQLIEYEQYYIDILNPTINICRIAYSCKGVIRSEEYRRKMSEAHKGKIVSEETRRKMKERVVSEETKRRISEAGKRRAPASEETRRKISEASKGKKHPPRSEETRRKISEAAKRRPPASEEKRRKMSESRKNPSEETRRKISEAGKGRKNPPISEETRRKMSAVQLKTPMAEILQHLQNWQISGLSQRAYCYKNGLSYKSFHMWIKRYPHVISEEVQQKLSEANVKFPISEILKHLQNWQSSGLSKRRYCHQNGLAHQTFNYWIEKHLP